MEELRNNNIITRHVKNVKEAEFKIAQAENDLIISKIALYEAEMELKSAVRKIEMETKNG